METQLLKDKSLLFGEDMVLTSTGDFSVVSGDEVILQAAQNRVMSLLGSREYDDYFGSELLYAMQTTNAYKISGDIVKTYIEQALQPMLEDGRIQEIVSVKIIQRLSDTIFVEIILRLGTYNGSIVIEMKNFLSN